MSGGQTQDLQLIWGAKAIARAIDRTPRVVFGMLENGQLPARKVNGRWVIEREALIRVFRGESA